MNTRTALARHRLLSALVIVLLLVAAAACGSPESSQGTASGDAGGSPPPSEPLASSAPTAPTAAATAAEGRFPATVEHRYGTTEIADAPERIVTVGLSDHDVVLAFGIAPVAVTDWYGDYRGATWPWAQDELGDATPEVMNKGKFTGTQNFQFEQIAALEPDLIIGLYTGMTEQEYDTLSQIAPTVAPSGDYPDYGMPWQESTRMVGQALGQPERAEEMIADVDDLFAQAAAEHPEFEGVEMVVAEIFEPGSSFARSATDPRTVFMTSLGFELPNDIAELAGDKDGAPISDEQMNLLDRDLLVWNIGFEPQLRTDIERKPLYPQLDVVRDDRVLFIEDPLVSGALTWSTVLSLPYALEHLVPDLADTVKS
jgi:iron complex transport system substrate-binding protein